jgi:translation initiation factor 3 subunit C
MVQRQQNVAEPVPSFYIRTLASLETSLNQAVAKEKEAKKKMNASNARALTAMKQKVKKVVKEYESDIKQYQEACRCRTRLLWSSDRCFRIPRSSSASITLPSLSRMHPLHRSLRRRKSLGMTKRRKRKRVSKLLVKVARPCNLPPKVSSNICSLYRKLVEKRSVLQAERHECTLIYMNSQNTDRLEQIHILEKLLEVAITPYQRIRILLALISSRFDYTPAAATHMPVELWLAAQREVDKLVAIVAAEPAYSVQEVTEEYDEFVERSPDTEKQGVVRIRGSIISFVDRLDDEFTKSLQNIDPHGTEYVDRLKDEKGLYCTICRAQAFYEGASQEDPLSRVIMRRLEHIYSKVCRCF